MKEVKTPETKYSNNHTHFNDFKFIVGLLEIFLGIFVANIVKSTDLIKITRIPGENSRIFPHSCGVERITGNFKFIVGFWVIFLGIFVVHIVKPTELIRIPRIPDGNSKNFRIFK